MRIAIIGSRDYPNLQHVIDYIDCMDVTDIVVSGGARGVDKTAENRAQYRGIGREIFPADWNKHGKSAGFIRNRDIIANADHVVAFWDGISRGTAHSMQLAIDMGKDLWVRMPDSIGLVWVSCGVA